MDRRNQNNYANQNNSNNSAYWNSRGMDKPNGWQATKSKSSLSKEEQDNRSRQMNSNHQSYHSSRGYK